MATHDVLTETFMGRLDVTIERVGKLKLDGCGEPLCMLVAQVDGFLSGESVAVIELHEHPYVLISFDRKGAKLVVRRKKA